MDLIIGGAYQGKLDYAMKKYGFSEDDVFTCGDSEIEFKKPCIFALEKFALQCVQNGSEAADILKINRKLWDNSVLICCDISCGIVPYDAQLRAWREMTGRMLNWLSGEADSVTRIFCGLPQVLK